MSLDLTANSRRVERNTARCTTSCSGTAERAATRRAVSGSAALALRRDIAPSIRGQAVREIAEALDAVTAHVGRVARCMAFQSC
jgi:hypothetical protein